MAGLEFDQMFQGLKDGPFGPEGVLRPGKKGHFEWVEQPGGYKTREWVVDEAETPEKQPAAAPATPKVVSPKPSAPGVPLLTAPEEITVEELLPFGATPNKKLLPMLIEAVYGS